MTTKAQELTIEEMENALGLDSIKAVHVSPGMQIDMNEDSAELQKWYEEELREVYAEYEKS